MSMKSFGSDPEFIALEGDRPRNALSVVTKQKIGLSTIFPDNVLAEINLPPSTNATMFEIYMRDALFHAKVALFPYTLEARASEIFPPDEMDHPGSYRFGCRPELDAWRLMNGRPTVVPPIDLEPGDRLRTCGGHIHVGMSVEKKDIPTYVRLMDLFVGVTSVLINNDNTSIRRHQLYGGAGKFRITPYGFEYRTLSNFWLARPELTRIIFNVTMLALAYPQAYVPADVIETIQHQDRESAQRIFDHSIAPWTYGTVLDDIDMVRGLPPGNLFQNWGV